MSGDYSDKGQIKKVISFSSGSVKKRRREGRFIFYFCDFFFILLWMASSPFIGHTMDTKVLKPLTALVKACTFGF